MNFVALGKTLMAVGVAIVLIGALLASGKGLGPLGRLPGDVRVEKENFGFYFPIVTCLVLSGLLSLILWAISRFR